MLLFTVTVYRITSCYFHFYFSVEEPYKMLGNLNNLSVILTKNSEYGG